MECTEDEIFEFDRQAPRDVCKFEWRIKLKMLKLKDMPLDAKIRICRHLQSHKANEMHQRSKKKQKPYSRA
mgnify:CR=1 FL=1